jgi:hypothetical protein
MASPIGSWMLKIVCKPWILHLRLQVEALGWMFKKVLSLA